MALRRDVDLLEVEIITDRLILRPTSFIDPPGARGFTARNLQRPKSESGWRKTTSALGSDSRQWR